MNKILLPHINKPFCFSIHSSHNNLLGKGTLLERIRQNPLDSEFLFQYNAHIINLNMSAETGFVNPCGFYISKAAL